MNRTCYRRVATPVAIAVAAAIFAAPSFAQSTSAGVSGVVANSSGAPVAGAAVTITHVESGTVSHTTTDVSGRYTVRGLRVGGPYTITMFKDGTTYTEEGVYLDLNEVGVVDGQLGADALEELDEAEIVATSGRGTFSSARKGVGTNILGRQLEITPQGTRSLDDVARLDPRISVTDQATGRISVAGVNNRFNSIAVDGLGQGDPFGLNSNGMPYTGSPISVDTISAYNVKTTDYDVAQDSVGASINAVTKSGTNEFHGSLYYAFKSPDFIGKYNANTKASAEYSLFDEDTTWGGTFGGPIVKDKLFFFLSYEQQDVTNFGGSFDDAFTTGKVTQAQIDQVINIARTVYGIEEPGTYGSPGASLGLKRYLGKLDWNISDAHRASLTYQQTEESNPLPYDQGSSTVILSTRWYQKDSTTKNAALQLFSNWTDKFSTEAKISYQKFDQLAGNAINLPTINISAGTGNSASSGQGIRFGEDRNRHENQINTEKLTASIFGTYYAGSHAIKGGFDYIDTDALNLYGRDLHGVYIFGSIADFAAGNYYRYDVRRPINGYTEKDTAAAVGVAQFSPYIQDTWQITPALSVTYGVRANIPKGDSAPPEKPGFESTFGFPNDYKLGSDNKVILPRLAFNWKLDSSQLRGGAGLFQSTPPYVWLANPFQNNGVSATGFCAYRTSATVSGCVNDTVNRLYDFSADPYNQPFPTTAAITTAQMDAIDPDYKMPTMWKFTLGYDQKLPWWGLVATAEVQHLKAKDANFYKALNIGTPNGTLADGRDNYWVTPTTGTSFTAKNNGLIAGYSNQSTLLTNTDQGKSTAVTLMLDKPLANGWYGNLSYTWTKAKEVGSDTSSQAWSSYQYVSRVNPNEEIATTATQEIRNSIKLSLGYEHAFAGNYKSSITAYYNGRNGLPYTWIMNGDPNGDAIFQDPAYIPLASGDTKVSYVNGTAANAPAATQAQIDAFNAFIDADPYLSSHRGQIAGRNGSRLPWVDQIDLGIQQELPGFASGHKSIIRLDIYNFLNMLNHDWGQQKSVGGFDTRYLAGLNRVNTDGTYVYNLGTPTVPTWQQLTVYDASNSYPSRVVSRWSALVTFKYQF